MTVLELARGGAHLAGVVSVHGTLTTVDPAQSGAVRARILVCHGILDPFVPMDHVKTFVEEMNAAEVDYQLIAYSGAMHGFTHVNADGSTPGVAYHKATDERSFAAMQQFFAELFDLPAKAGSH
jgi:dienelactone hydrolase